MSEDKLTAQAPQLELDRPVHAQLARMTQGVSPAFLGNAYIDWLTHLALSPGKQAELVEKAMHKTLRFTSQIMAGANESCRTCMTRCRRTGDFRRPNGSSGPST